MSGFNFPNSPTDGQTFTPITGGHTYVFGAGVWKVVTGTVIANATISISDTAPTTPDVGQLWWESDSGNMFIWHDDGNTQQWVQVSGGAVMAPNVTEIVALAPTSTPQHNCTTGAAVGKNVNSIINIAPTVSMVLTGIDTTGWEAGKQVILRNATSRLGADARCIIIPRNSSLSTAANRFQYPGNKRLPLILMPEETADFYFNGTDLKLLKASRPFNLTGYFDYTFDGHWPGGGWTNGTGAGTTYQNNGNDAAGDAYCYMTCQTGSTAAGRCILADNAASHMTGQGAILCLSRVNIPVLSNATDEFIIRAGYTEAFAAPNDEICWQYYRPNSVNWQTKTVNNGVATNTTITALPVATADTPLLGVFVNGDGTRVEFFYSNDLGVTWQFTPTPHTTNIPTGINRLFTFGVGIWKMVGTVSCFVRLLFCGSLGWV